ncbi:membrane protein [Rhizobium sp. LC145]|uniref:membrane protein n=1 Tax=Rhizobium sp. LC145 TaxID=1120688 RepID=UPI000629F318|nr:membrane protein [Rhizobium sp. LC145]KKX30377.1 membrane protein [Rhizobium sp. LC145]TKT56743.1 hypothetical protein FDR95_14750 [Rhizobiaceae bacterium LC148]
MRSIFVSISLILVLAGCTAHEAGLEPIPGSITYGGQPRTKLTKAPVGSTVTNRLNDELGRPAEETYIIQPDRSLKLVSRHIIEFRDD